MRASSLAPALRLVTTFLLLVSVAVPQMRNMAIDEMRLLKGANKVAIFIKLGPTLPAPYKPDYERAKQQIGKKLEKQKLQLVLDPTQADLVFVVTEYNSELGATASATTVGTTTTGTARDLICLCDEIKVFKGGRIPADSDNFIGQ